MLNHPRLRFHFTNSLPSFVFLILAIVLLLFGGASREDALGQTVVRIASISAIIIATLAGPRPDLVNAKPVAWILSACALLCVLQLIPLPPGLWQALPGRETLAQAAQIAGESQPWRPLSISPGATINALASLLVPAAVLLLFCQLSQAGREKAAGLMLVLAAISMVAGLIQFGGVDFALPWSDRDPTQPSGTFANRNHFALLCAIGTLLAIAWAAMGANQALPRRGALALGVVALFTLAILASGSRAGLLVGAVGLGLGTAIGYPIFRRRMRGFPRWAVPIATIGALAIIALLITTSIMAGRAVSINRVLAIDFGQDMRSRGLPVVWNAVIEYYPAGTGFGTFDSTFRLHEPLELLSSEFFNHAHNDFLEIALNGGVLGILIAVSAIVWWLFASVRVWRSMDFGDSPIGKVGSATIGLVLLASLFDYPARTPFIMALLVIAGMWLSATSERSGSLPGNSRPL